VTGGGVNGLDLYASQAAAGFDDEVVGFTVAEWLADGESETYSFEDEEQFGEFPLAFGEFRVDGI
jgi:hypothetical protein